MAELNSRPGGLHVHNHGRRLTHEEFDDINAAVSGLHFNQEVFTGDFIAQQGFRAAEALLRELYLIYGQHPELRPKFDQPYTSPRKDTTVLFGTLGTIHEFAKRSGQEPNEPRTLASYSSMLALGHKLGNRQPDTSSATAYVAYVGQTSTPDQLTDAIVYDDGSEPRFIYRMFDEDAPDEFGTDKITLGMPFWLTTERMTDLEADGDSLPRLAIEIDFPDILPINH